MLSLYRKPGRSWVLLAILLGSAPAVGQQVAGSHTLAAGAYLSDGDYGAQLETTIRYFPISYGYQGETWALQLAVPYLEIDGLGNALVNVGGVTRTRLANERINAAGLGDVVASATYKFPAFSDTGLFLDLVMEAKLPTADENKGLGTGEPDYSVQMDVFQGFGSVTAFATLGYRWRGKTELFAGLSNSAFSELGFAVPMAEAWSGGVIYSYGAPASDFSSEIHELLPYVSWELNERWSLLAYGVWGFTVDSPDFAFGTQLSLRW